MRLGAIHVRRTIYEPLLNSCRRQFIASYLARIQHIFNENSVSHAGIVYHNVCDRADELSVLNDGAAAHECGQEGTTLFNEKFTKSRREQPNGYSLQILFSLKAIMIFTLCVIDLFQLLCYTLIAGKE